MWIGIFAAFVAANVLAVIVNRKWPSISYSWMLVYFIATNIIEYIWLHVLRLKLEPFIWEHVLKGDWVFPLTLIDDDLQYFLFLGFLLTSLLILKMSKINLGMKIVIICLVTWVIYIIQIIIWCSWGRGTGDMYGLLIAIVVITSIFLAPLNVFLVSSINKIFRKIPWKPSTP